MKKLFQYPSKRGIFLMCQDVRIYEESNFNLYGFVVCSDFVCVLLGLTAVYVLLTILVCR